MDVSAVTSTPHPRLDAQHAEAAAQAAIQAESEESKPPPIDIGLVVSELEQVSAAFNRRLSFSFNEKLGQVVVKVIDRETDKVIKEIPPVELQHVHERIREVIGILFDERA